MWKTARFDDDVINPPPVRLWAALPLFLGGAEPGDTDSRLDVGDIGDAFWNANGKRARFWFFLGRLMIIPLATMTGLAIAVWSRAWYGDRSALVSVLIWTCCPTAIANASIVTHDLPLAAFWVITVLALARFAEDGTWQRAVQFGAALGAALLTKLTAVILIPLCIVLWFILRIKQATPSDSIQAAAGSRMSAIAAVARLSCWKLITRWIGALGLAVLMINACYLFRGSGTALGDLKLSGSQLQAMQQAASSIGWLPIPIPRDYVAAIDRLAQDLDRKHPVYLDGEWRDRPFSWYYAAALVYKMPLSNLALILAGLVAFAWPRRNSCDFRHGLFLLTAALTLPVLASQSSNQIGIRYVLPAIPILCIFAGQSGRWLDGTSAHNSWARRLVWFTAWMTVFVAPLSLRFHPHHLAYFNYLAGGPDGGGWHLVDSNVDWGQDLHALHKYLDNEKIQDIGLAYFGTVVPSTIGIDAHEPPRNFPQPGWYAISVNFVHGRPHVLRVSKGERVQVGLGEFSYFRAFEPVATIGYSINVYHLTPQDVSRYAFQLQKAQRSR